MRMRPPTWPCARFSPGEHVTEVAGVHIHRLTLSQGRTPEGIWNSRAALVPIVDDHHGNADRADHERINGWGRGCRPASRRPLLWATRQPPAHRRVRR